MARIRVFLCLFLVVVVALGGWVNAKYEVVAVNPFFGEEEHELRVLTWNVHRSGIKDGKQQAEMARLVLAQGADLVQLNEFTLDSCRVLDSLLRCHYAYTEDVKAKQASGDIIYSKRELFNSGKRKTSKMGKESSYLEMTILCGKDSVYLVGVHLTGNNDSVTNIRVRHETEAYYRYFYKLYKKRMEERKVSAYSLKQWAMECRHPMIIMGDMNDFSVSAPMDSLKDAGMRNAWWEGGMGYGATFKQGLMRLRIDHIFYNSGLELKGVRVVETDLSDHFIVVGDFSISR